MLEIAGLVVSAIGLTADMAGKIADWKRWEEAIVPVDGNWLALAIDKGILEGAVDEYFCSREEKVATRQLKGTHDVVVAANEEKRLKYRLVRGREGNRLVLMKRLAK